MSQETAEGESSKFLNRVVDTLQSHGLKLTKARTDILNVIASRNEALSPYTIQDILKNQDKKYSAITIYRVIETLLESDIIHKVHSINSYVKCCEEDDHHHHRLLVCKNCHIVKSMESTANELESSDFSEILVIDEILGVCDKCKKK